MKEKSKREEEEKEAEEEGKARPDEKKVAEKFKDGVRR